MSRENQTSNLRRGFSLPWQRPDDPDAVRRWIQFAIEVGRGVLLIAIAWLLLVYLSRRVEELAAADEAMTVWIESVRVWLGYLGVGCAAVIGLMGLLPCIFNDSLDDADLKEADAILRFFGRRR